MIRLRHTVSLTLIIAASAAVIALPTPREERAARLDPFRQQLFTADARLKRASELLRREDSRSLAIAAAATVKSAGGLTIVRPPDVPVAFERGVRFLAERSFAALPRHDSVTRTIIVLTIDTGATVSGVPVVGTRYSMMSVDAFPPGTIAPNTCIAVVRAHYRGLLRSPEAESRFEPEKMRGRFNACQWYRAFGTPGRGVSAWLDSTRFTAIQQDDRGAYNWLPWRQANDWEERTRNDRWVGREPSRYAMASCADGRDESCLSLLLTNIGQDRGGGGNQLPSRAWIGEGRAYNAPANMDAAALLHRLLAEMGPAQFAAFWKSDAAIPEAFSIVRGGSFATWVRTQARSVVPTERARVLPRVSAIITLIIAAAALLLLGSRAVARRSGFA